MHIISLGILPSFLAKDDILALSLTNQQINSGLKDVISSTFCFRAITGMQHRQPPMLCALSILWERLSFSFRALQMPQSNEY